MTAIDAVEMVPNVREEQCAWCECTPETLYRYGTRHGGTMYWSGLLCSTDCHDVLHADDFPPLNAEEVGRRILSGLIDPIDLAAMFTDGGAVIDSHVVWANAEGDIVVWAGNDLDPNMDNISEHRIGRIPVTPV